MEDLAERHRRLVVAEVATQVVVQLAAESRAPQRDQGLRQRAGAVLLHGSQRRVVDRRLRVEDDAVLEDGEPRAGGGGVLGSGQGSSAPGERIGAAP